MSQYWIGDALGRVLGPVSLQAIRDLLSRGRLTNLTRASTDGRSWKPLAEVPEVFALVSSGVAQRPAPTIGSAPSQPASPYADEIARITVELTRLRGLSPREQLGVAANARVEDARTSFFTKVKQFHPTRLPPNPPPALQRAYADMFQQLSDAMALIEKEKKTAAEAATPTYASEQFLGWRREKDRVEVELELGPDNAHLVLNYPQASAANDGFYLPSRSPLPLFQEVEVTLKFKGSSREIRGKGRVVLDSSREKIPGLGIRFLALSADDRSYLQYFAKKASLARGSQR
jgi:curved DNA-binding protein CbpA